MAMLPDKTENTYTRLFQELVAAATGIQRQLRPQVVHTDFETAVINALYNVFSVHSTGCLFHFAQYIYRKETELGLKVEYHTDNPQGTRKWIRRIMALPLVPPGRIAGTLAVIQRDAPIIPHIPQAVQDMHGYLRNKTRLIGQHLI